MKFFLFFSFGFFLFGMFILWRLFWPLSFTESKVLVDVPKGKTFYQIAEELEQKKLIRNSLDMKILVKLSDSPLLPKGEYELSPHQSLWKVFQTLKQGKEREFFVRFPEGLNHYEMAEVLKSHNWPGAKDFLKQVWDKKFIQSALNQNLNSLEGYLFPDSYRLKKYMSANKLIQTMLKRFWSAYNKVSDLPCKKIQSKNQDRKNLSVKEDSIKSAPTVQQANMDLKDKAQMACSIKHRFTLHQVVTLASLVEKETGLATERPLISGVFHNRLNKNMKLQTDPSILYALYLTRGFGIEKNIRKPDILFSSPYNTYVVKGLPPGPIANPGAESLYAVFFTEQSDYLYFVSRNDGSHKFSKTYKEHQKAVYKYQIKAFQNKNSNKK